MQASKLAIGALAVGALMLAGCGGGGDSGHRFAITVSDDAPSNAICPPQHVQVTVFDGSGSIIGSGFIPPTGSGCSFRGRVPTSKADEYVIALGSQPDSPSADRQTVSSEQLTASDNTVAFGG